VLVTEPKPMEEILAYLKGERGVFVLGCNGCAEACETGGTAAVTGMVQNLKASGLEVSGAGLVDFLCEKALVKVKMARRKQELASADSLLVLACGVGVQVTAAVVDKAVHPACNTLSLGGAVGKWWGNERCRQCGDCQLDWTGGICPLTTCSKGLLNGPCGGSKAGRCEVEPDVRECGWGLIYERLKKTGRLEKLHEIRHPKRYDLMEPPRGLRTSLKWDLERGVSLR